MSSGLRVLRPGLRSLLQDGGRAGSQHVGISPCGPLDWRSAAWANRLLGNDCQAAVLEVVLGNLELQAEQDLWLAVTGAAAEVRVEGCLQPADAAFPLARGESLRIGFPRQGQFNYLAVAGGFQAPAVLGSQAVQMREGLGGLHGDGQPLQAGDLLPCQPSVARRRCQMPWRFRPDWAEEPTCGLLAAPALQQQPALLQALQQNLWQISPQSDRMGLRLQGTALPALPGLPWSQGVVTGTVQLPPDGQPIVLLSDRQTMGGYPVLGWIPPQDLWQLVQIPAHRPLRLAQVDAAQARAHLQRILRFFRQQPPLWQH